ncbi:MAG: sugar phosphate isomerase/epimerase [bacterium]|nr:sugar phosphate isomerase/epimerase [bacterium]
MYYTGIADEAAPGLAGQIRATKELGWRHIESRNIDGVNIHDMTDEAFEHACETLAGSGVSIDTFASAIANWGKKIDQPFDNSLAEARRAIPRMRRLGAMKIRIMSFAVMEDREPDDQMEGERFRRLRELTAMFTGEGITPVHENCMNYGGMGWRYTLRMLENVPGLKLVYDTGNPVFTWNRQEPKPWRRQSSWEFYRHVKEHIVHVHVKDGWMDEANNKMLYTFPGEGDGDVEAVLADLLAGGYEGGLSIEPHMATVFHDKEKTEREELMYANYTEYGRRLMALVEGIPARK